MRCRRLSGHGSSSTARSVRKSPLLSKNRGSFEEMRGPAISVAMCTYNGARFLAEQLGSLAAQSRLPDELVVCDDGSTDESAEIVKDFARHAPFPVRLEVNEENLGATKNFEKAIGLCRGEVIALSDQDDVWYPKKLELHESVFVADPSA